MDDLPQIKAVYEKIIAAMDDAGIHIWDEIYPCEFFRDDIKNDHLFILTEGKEIVAAFALCDTTPGADHAKWEDEQAEALYIDRFGVNADYSRQGIGSLALAGAIALAREKGATYLRLFVVDVNEPAINFYLKNGFTQIDGIYDERIDDDLVLHKFGFEMRMSRRDGHSLSENNKHLI